MGPGRWALVPGTRAQGPGPFILRSKTTNPGSETTNLEQNHTPEPSGWVPGSKTAIFGSKIRKVVPRSGSIFRIRIRKGPRGPRGPKGPRGHTLATTFTRQSGRHPTNSV